MVPRYLWFIAYLQLFSDSACGQLPESLQPFHSACFGTHTMFQPSCTSNDTVIAVQDIKVGVKFSTSSCPVEVEESVDGTSIMDSITGDPVSSSCCVFEDGDCAFTYDTSTLPQPYKFFFNCTGLSTCNQPNSVVRDQTPGHCTTSYSSFTTYMFMEYYCIDETRLGDMCGTVSTNLSGSAFYLQSPGYPNSISSSYNAPCSCSVQSSICDVAINIYTIHVDMASDGSTCRQTLTINDTGQITEWSCSSETVFNITISTSSDNYILVELNNNLPSDGGYAWLGFEANQNGAELMINCPAIPETSCTTTTTTTTTTTGSTTTSASASEGGGGGGSSLIMIIAAVIGILGLIVAAVIIYCCCCKKKKEQNKVEPEKEKPDSESVNDMDNDDSDDDVPIRGLGFRGNSVAPANTHFNRSISHLPPLPLHLQETRYIMEHSGTNQVITYDDDTKSTRPPARLDPIIRPKQPEGEVHNSNQNLSNAGDRLHAPVPSGHLEDSIRSVTPGDIETGMQTTYIEQSEEKRKKKKKKRKKKKSKKSKRRLEEDEERLAEEIEKNEDTCIDNTQELSNGANIDDTQQLENNENMNDTQTGGARENDNEESSV